MRILIVTSNARFFQQVYSICRQLHPEADVDHVSDDIFAISPLGALRAGGIAISDGKDPRFGVPQQNLENAFAVIGVVCQNNGPALNWIPVTRGDLILWIRDIPFMTNESSLFEEVVFQSPHARLARFRVPTCCRLIPQLRDRLLKGLSDFHVSGGTRSNHFCLALEEALNNAFYHGNLEISSELKEDGSSRFVDLASERELHSPWSQRRVHVTELVSEFGVWITIQDEGPGFDVGAAIERCNDPESLLASGRGLLLMRAFSDELFYNATGNEVTLVLYGDNEQKELPLGTVESSGAERRYIPGICQQPDCGIVTQASGQLTIGS